MAVRLLVVFLLLALSVGVDSLAYGVPEGGLARLIGKLQGGGGLAVGDFIDEEEEMMIDSDAIRRALAQARRYISYGALRKDSIPCNRRGQSYYNCVQMKKANPYRRGCSTITRCKRFTD